MSSLSSLWTQHPFVVGVSLVLLLLLLQLLLLLVLQYYHFSYNQLYHIVDSLLSFLFVIVIIFTMSAFASLSQLLRPTASVSQAEWTSGTKVTNTLTGRWASPRPTLTTTGAGLPGLSHLRFHRSRCYSRQNRFGYKPRFLLFLVSFFFFWHFPFPM